MWYGRKLAFQLRSEVANLNSEIRYANFDTETKQCKIAYTSADHLLTQVLGLFECINVECGCDW
jgi:DNA polymerase-4